LYNALPTFFLAADVERMGRTEGSRQFEFQIAGVDRDDHRAPAMGAALMALSPTPPQPKTTATEPAFHVARY